MIFKYSCDSHDIFTSPAMQYILEVNQEIQNTGCLLYTSDSYKSEVVTTMFIGMAMLIPLASIFLSHAATYSNELDKNVPERILLFGFSEKRCV